MVFLALFLLLIKLYFEIIVDSFFLNEHTLVIGFDLILHCWGRPWLFFLCLNKTVLLSLCPQDSSESSSSAPATQFIMLPLPAYSVVDNPTSIKLVSVGYDGD